MPSRPVFLMGCPRSGTTLLSAMLHAHPEIAVAPETRFLLPAYERREEFGDLTVAANRRRLGEFITGRGTLFKDLRIDRDAVIEAVAAAPPTLGSAVSRVWQQFAADRGASRWIEKRPAYWRHIPTLLRLFPDAQIVHLVRDPRAVVASLLQVDWFDDADSVPHTAALWVQAEHELRKWGRRLPADSYHRLRFEDLTADPRGELGRLTDFLAAPFAEQMLDHHSAATDLVARRKVWHDRVRGPIDTTRVDAWRTALDPRDVGLIELGAGPAMRRNGYRPSGVAQRPALTDLADFQKRVFGMRLKTARGRLADARLRRRHPMPLPCAGREGYIVPT